MAYSLTTANIPEPKRFDYWRDTLCGTFVHLDFLRTSDRPFHGELATWRVNEVTFTRVRSEEYRIVRTPRHIRLAREAVVFVNLQLRGTLLCAQDGREVKLAPGDLTCFDSTRPYSGVLSGGFEQLVLHVPRDLWIRKMGPSEPLTARAVRGTTPIGSLVRNFLCEAAEMVESAGEVTAQRVSELSLALVTTAFGELLSQQEGCQSSGRIALLYRAKAFMEENLHDPDLNPEKVAQALRISERYLQRLFQEDHSTVSNWIWQRRLEKCRRDLMDPLLAGKSVSQIAFDCGFSNFSHFARRFKAAFATSASDLRREHRPGLLQ